MRKKWFAFDATLLSIDLYTIRSRLPCPSYRNNNRPSLCHWKWRQLCFLPSQLIYERLTILDHRRHQYLQPKSPSNQLLKSQSQPVQLRGRTVHSHIYPIKFPFPGVLNFQLKTLTSWSEDKSALHEVQKCIKVGDCASRDFAPMVNLYRGVIYGHDMSMQMMAQRK